MSFIFYYVTYCTLAANLFHFGKSVTRSYVVLSGLSICKQVLVKISSFLFRLDLNQAK